MRKDDRGPLAWLRRWNHRRLEARHLRRGGLAAQLEDDAIILEALSRLLALAELESPVEAARRRKAIADRLGTLDDRLGGLDDRLAEVVPRLGALDDLLGEVVPRLVRMEGRLVDALARPADPFPQVATARPALLEPELEVLAQLAPWLAPRVAIDVGAHHGKFTGLLLEAGFTVHAMEPNPEARAELDRRLGGRPGLTVHPAAAGAEDGTAELRLVADANGFFPDASQFSSLAGLPLPDGLTRAGSVRVPVRRLDSLVREAGLAPPSVVKIDAEGIDLDVLRGLGELRPALVQAEFWDEALPLSGPGARNRLPDLIAHGRAHGAPWHLVIFRRWGDERPAYYTGWTESPERSWGNVYLFADRALFERGREVVAGLIPEARFLPGKAS